MGILAHCFETLKKDLNLSKLKPFLEKQGVNFKDFVAQAIETLDIYYKQHA